LADGFRRVRLELDRFFAAPRLAATATPAFRARADAPLRRALDPVRRGFCPVGSSTRISKRSWPFGHLGISSPCRTLTASLQTWHTNVPVISAFSPA
jgi:hypothetical protein